MLKLFLTLLSICSMLIIHSQINIGSPEIVASQNPWGNVRPRVALNASQQPVVIWTNTNEGNVYCSTKVGSDFTTPVKLNPNGMMLSTFDWSGPEIAAFGDKLVTVMKATPEMEEHIYIVLSQDGGISWSDTIRVENSLLLLSRMPSVAFDNEGNPLVSFLRQDMVGFSEWAVAKSMDGGQTFLPAVSVSTGFTDAVCDCCPSNILIDNNLVAVVYRNNENNLRDIRTSVSIDGGLTFNSQYDLDDMNWVVQSCPASGPSSFISDNKILAAWMSDATTDSRVYFSSFDLTNETFDGNLSIQSAPSSQVQNYPTTAGNSDLMAVAYEKNVIGQREIVFAYGDTENMLIAPTVIELTNELSGNQMRPNMVYSDGKFHLVYTNNGEGNVIYQVIENNPIGVVESESDQKISIWPNPSSSFVHCSIQKDNGPAQMTLRIVDCFGKIIHESAFYGANLQTDVSSIANGVYSFEVLNGFDLLANEMIVISHP